MKKHLILLLTMIFISSFVWGCSNGNSVNDFEKKDEKVVLAESNEEDETEEPATRGTVFLNSTRKGAITKAANPIVGINFDDTEKYYDITKTDTNFQIQPVSENSEPFYVMFDSPDEVVIGDFAYGFATAISTKWEDLIHIYDFDKNVVHKVVTPLHTGKIKKISDSKYAVQYTTDDNKVKSMSFSTPDKYAYNLFISTKDMVMIVDGGTEYDARKEISGESEGATTVIEDGTTVVHTETTANNSLRIVTETTVPVQTTEANFEETDEIILADEEESVNLSEDETAISVNEDDVKNYDETKNAVELNEKGEQAEKSVSVDTDLKDVVEETYYIINEDELAPEDEITAERTIEIEGGKIINAPVIAQFPFYPTGCESVSATMALQYAGLDISVDEFIDNYLDKSNDFYIENGMRIGPSPHEYFIGSPYDESGFGCMANVIYNAFLKIYEGDTTRIVNATGIPLEELCKDYISNDMPVVIWENIAMTDAYDSNTWNLADGTQYIWKSGEHCMLLVGYDNNNYYFNDPYTGKQVSYPKSVSEKCYSQQGMQAVVIMK